MDEWMTMDEWISKCVDGWMTGSVSVGMDDWMTMDEWISECGDGWMSG